MKKIFLYGLTLFGLSLSIAGCMPKDDLEYDGPNVVEFKNHLQSRLAASLPAGATANGALTRTVRVTTRPTDTIYVQLVGPQQSSPIDLNFSVAATSTAVAGTHYNLRPLGTTKVTIPANSSVGYLLTDMVATSIPVATPATTYTLIYNLIGNEQIKASPNYSTFTLTLRN
ncbi:MAG TPA: hypothetical protein VF679_12275 [Pedobacter sp.]|jgi:hypothetical protein